MKLYKKSRESKATELVINDIQDAFCYLIQQKNFATDRNSILSITITNTGCKHEKDLNHVITNRLFNTIKNDYKDTMEHTNYLFVIEYPELVSIGKHLPTNCEVHSHIVINTSLTEENIMKYLRQTFSSSVNIAMEDITMRNDKEKYRGYMVKQGRKNYFLSNNSYNYKINVN